MVEKLLKRIKINYSSVLNKFFNNSNFEFSNLEKDNSSIKKRVERDFIYLRKLSEIKNKKLAIVSIDMQEDFVSGIYPKKKKEILLYYHYCMLNLCKQNDIPFILINYSNHKNNLISSNLIFEKTEDYVNNLDFFNYLKDNNLDLLYVIGINRKACVLSSIKIFIDNGFQVCTSFLGTANNNSPAKSYNGEKTYEDLSDIYRHIYYEKGIFGLRTLRKDISVYFKMGVDVIDYYDFKRFKQEFKK